MGAWIIVIAAIGAPSVGDFVPCVPRQTLVYRRLDAEGRDLGFIRTDRVERKKGSLCFVRRTTQRPDGATTVDVYVLEVLADRVLDAGWADAMTAFRAPLLRGPIRDGHDWAFNRVRYRLAALDGAFETPAGRFSSAIRVSAESIPQGRFWMVRTYARGVGLVEERSREGAWRAVEFRPAKEAAEKRIGEGGPRGSG